MSDLAKFVGMLRSHYADGCTVRFGAKYAAAIVAEYDALKARAESARCEPVDAGGCAPPVIASVPPADVDTIALEVARRFTLDTEPQRRASLQVAVVEAIRVATSASIACDTRRLDFLSDLVETAYVCSCFEMDGGIHLTIERPSHEQEAYRWKNNLREALDAAMAAPKVVSDGE